MDFDVRAQTKGTLAEKKELRSVHRSHHLPFLIRVELFATSFGLASLPLFTTSVIYAISGNVAQGFGWCITLFWASIGIGNLLALCFHTVRIWLIALPLVLLAVSGAFLGSMAYDLYVMAYNLHHLNFAMSFLCGLLIGLYNVRISRYSNFEAQPAISAIYSMGFLSGLVFPCASLFLLDGPVIGICIGSISIFSALIGASNTRFAYLYEQQIRN